MPIEYLPRRWRPPLLRVRDVSLTNAPALLILGISIILRGISYIPSDLGGVIDTHPAEGVLPIGVWALVWIGIGVMCLVSAVWRDGMFEAVSMGLGLGLNALWAVSFFAASVTGEMPRGWVTGTGYAALTLTVLWSVWRDKRATELAFPSQEEVAHELRRGDQ